PLARRLAGEAGIDLTAIQGSGPHGRIVARDVTAALAKAPRGVAAPAATGPTARAPTADQVKALYADTPYAGVPLDNTRRTIAARLTQAVQTIPHFYLTADIGIERLLAVREQANAATDEATKLSLNDFIIKALALALQRVPAANAVWADDRILRFRHSDIGVAVAMQGGLLTPVIRQAETKSISTISAEMKELADRSHDSKLKPHQDQRVATAKS